MTGKSHKKFALHFTNMIIILILFVTLSFTFNINDLKFIPLLWVFLSVIGGYFPDIDKNRTTASKFFNKVHLIFQITLALIGCIMICFINVKIDNIILIGILSGLIYCLSFYISKLKHRRETHSLTFLILCFFLNFSFYIILKSISDIIAVIIFNLGIGFLLGILSHILIDLFNDVPLHLFFPLEIILQKSFKTKKPVYLIPAFHMIKTSSPQETNFINIFVILLWIITAFFIILFYLR